MGENIALTDAVDERRLGGSASCFEHFPTFESVIPKAARRDSVSSGYSELLANSGIDWIVGNALVASKDASSVGDRIRSPFPSNRMLDVGSLIHVEGRVRASCIERNHTAFSRGHAAASSNLCSLVDKRKEQGNMAEKTTAIRYSYGLIL